MKRFTETLKWRDPWFRRLPEESRLLWLWLCDNCDQAGVIELDLEIASFDIGKPIEKEHVAALGDRLQILQNGKRWIPSFIPFQYGRLSQECRPHGVVFDLLTHHGIDSKPFVHSKNDSTTPKTGQRVSDSLSNNLACTRQDKDKDKEKDKDKDKDQQQGGVGGGNGVPDVDLPSTFPSTKEDAIAWAAGCGLPDEFVLRTWQKAYGRGGRDAKDIPIRSWSHYVQCESKYERARAQQPTYLIPNL